MNRNTGRIGVAASFLGRLSLLLVMLGGGAGSMARVVPAPHDAFTIAPATFSIAPAGHNELRMTRVVGDGRVSAGIATQALPIDRLDEVAFLSAAALDATPFAETPLRAPPARYETRPSTARASYGLPLPEPDGWTAVAATIALALFFFLRRLA